MSTPDPFDQRIAEIASGVPIANEPVDPFDQRIAELSGSASGPIDEASRSAWERFIEGVGNTAETLEAFTPMGLLRPGANERRTAAAVGVVSEALINPAKAVSQIPTAVALATEDALGTPGALLPVRTMSQKAYNFLERTRVGLLTAAEENALEAGLTEEEVANAYAVGGFVGFTLPVAGAVKGASLLLRSPVVLSRHISAGTLVTDMVAGAIYGGVFREGETLEERGKNMLDESALFGVGRLLLNGIPLAFGAYRLKRARDLDVAREIEKHVMQMRDDLFPTIQKEKTGAGLAKLLSEESYISSSAAAQDIFERSADESALVQAIVDVSRSRASGGKLSGLNRPLEEVDDLLSRFRQQFPALKFEPVKSGDGFDIFFGVKGLNNRQRAQLAAERKAGVPKPRFEGMKVFRNADEYTYVSRASREGYVRLRRTDDTVVEVLEKNITDLPMFEEPIERTPRLDALFDDFRSFFIERGDEAAKGSGKLSESSLIRLAREGKLKITDEGRRAFDVGGAIIYPEELGLEAGERGISAIRLRAVDPNDFQRASIHRNTIPGEGPWRVTILAEENRVVGHFPFNSIDEAAKAAQDLGFAPEEIVHNFATANGVRASIARNGTEFANILEPPQVYPFEKVFDDWVRERAIPAGSADLPAAREAFAQRLRREFWQSVPEEDRKIFEAVRKELDDAFERGDVPLSAIAHSKGFHIEKLDDGRTRLREINTGASFDFGEERFAESFLREVVRDERSMAQLLDPGANGMPSISGGLRNPAADDWRITPESILRQTPENLPQATFRNVRDWLIGVEETLGIPLFSRGFSEIDSGLSRMRNRYEPFSKQIQSAWKGLDSRSKEEVVDFWRRIEGTPLPREEIVRMAKDAGLSTRQIAAFEKARAIWDEGFRLAGLPPSRYINNYYGRVKPWVDKNNAPADFDKIFGPEGVPAEFQFFAEMSRTGELAMVETDPEIVMHKWFRSLFFAQEVKPSWDRLAQLVDRGHGQFRKPSLKIRELPQEMIESLVRANPSIDINAPVLSPPIQDVISEYLTIVRGNPGVGLEKLRWFSRKFFSSLGVKADERVMEEFFNTYMSSMYGAAMGLRPSLVARNATQTMWNLYPRLGNRFSGKALEVSLTKEGFNEAIDSGAIRLTESGIPFSDAIFENLHQNMDLRGSNAFSQAVAGAVRKGLRMGYVSRKVAEKFLIPYSSGDQISRAWAFHWQKLHTDRVLRDWEMKRIGWEKFEEDGLPMFSKAVKDEFTERLRNFGREDALRFIGKQAADETHFIYGVGAQPAWMQKPLGRLFGMFGTWPLWAGELYLSRVGKGTRKQQAAFVARTVALVGAFGNMSLQSGVDLWNWISPLSIGWAGGPAVEHAINLKRFIDAPMDQKASAAKRFVADFGRLSLPGQLFVHDLEETMKFDNPRDQFMRLMMGRPNDVEHFAMSYMFSGDDVPNYVDVSPETERALEGIAPRPGRLPTIEELSGGGMPQPAGFEESINFSEAPDFSGLQGNF